jgi:hypothetical protein
MFFLPTLSAFQPNQAAKQPVGMPVAYSEYATDFGYVAKPDG